ncbi:hypothetical protein BaRGS_00020282 [Batillaria attramentaria]|uniref:G-patch domain-containing protein n=1 Tax=Batillaria attramentaria TaxID=370345 RepID=A0ABD0KN08_9CAEN
MSNNTSCKVVKPLPETSADVSFSGALFGFGDRIFLLPREVTPLVSQIKIRSKDVLPQKLDFVGYFCKMDGVLGGSVRPVYAVVNNIPQFYHSADLRRFFSRFVETKGFECFHFRHRPEQQSVKTSLEHSSGVATTSTKKQDSNTKTFCCIIKLKENRFTDLIRTYHQRHWQDSQGESISSCCLISRLKISSVSVEGDSTDCSHDRPATKYQTRGDKKRIPPEREEFKEEDLQKLPELRPPSVMPNGNVGTTTSHFLALIKECKLPPSVIKKLQLDFPKSKDRGKYGSVPFDYKTGVEIEEDVGSDLIVTSSEVLGDSDNQVEIVPDNTGSADGDAELPSSTLSSQTQPDYREVRRLKKLAKRERRKLMDERIEEKMVDFEKAGSDSGDDNDTCEEWERHEAMYDDVTNQGRNKDRLFEEEMEIVWEKGGSGLVFYTDAQYWQEKEGDFDEQTADDLDVDMSAYYETGAGDKDIRDFVTIRQEQRRRRGLEQTDRFSAGIGKFERHTKGIGRKILEKQGWTEGEGLGSTIHGIADALDNEGQHPRDKKGLGYRGEKLVKYGSSVSRKRKHEGEALITTVYDNPTATDPVEPLLRRNDPSYIKHRDRIN